MRRRVLFERFHEFDQIAFVRRASREYVYVIGQNTIRMDEKRARLCVPFKTCNDPRSDMRICGEAATTCKAQRNEIEASAAITSGRETDLFSVQRQAGNHDCYAGLSLKSAALRLNLTTDHLIGAGGYSLSLT